MHAYEAEIQGVMNAVCEVEAGQRQDEIDDLEAQLAVKQDWLESWEFQASECMPSARRGNPVQSGQVGYCMGTLSNIQTKYREIEELRARIAEVKNRPPEDDFCE